jgi:carbonic anhydrase
MSKLNLLQREQCCSPRCAGCKSKLFGSFGEKANLAMPPARKFAILTCMDARLDPAKYAGLSEGDACYS